MVTALGDLEEYEGGTPVYVKLNADNSLPFAKTPSTSSGTTKLSKTNTSALGRTMFVCFF